jgi:RNA-binding protein PNO1
LRYTIENATRTRIVVAGETVHILGSYDNVSLAKNAICHLIMGSPPSKIYSQMRVVASRLKQRF